MNFDSFGCFVEHGDAGIVGDYSQFAGLLKSFGGTWAGILRLGNDNDHRPEMAVRFRDEMRSRGIACPMWVVIDAEDNAPDPDWDRIAGRTLELAPHFDGIILNMERIEKRGNLIYAVRPITEQYTGSGMWSCLPMMAGGEVTRVLDNALWTLGQQGYQYENGWTPRMCRDYIARPPMYVGWWYRAVVLGRSLRGQIIGEDSLGFKFKEGTNTWGVNRSTRQIFNRKTGKIVGQLQGLWAIHRRLSGTVRTTPMGDGRFFTVTQAQQEIAFSGMPGAGNVYLGETTNWV